ncbi:hypothetical protein OV079_52540 [Nannocystis pusilla]|uniref:Uncharacterized protein n=1 Tax=Nannocystis pusilla TaxID=889268 RepID=A0A9X3F2E5_9BACT|nr:hypothetical protein [Nannocystis pusilla]MCY1014015.1 hypothetical protein [Nannocystis pusilla]
MGLLNGMSMLRLMRDGGRLRRCGERECDRTAESIADELIGETVRVELHNRCSEDIEVAMMPCGLEVPPADAPPAPRGRRAAPDLHRRRAVLRTRAG